MTTPWPSSGPFARLVALHPDIQPAEFTIESEVCFIGRSPSCQVVAKREIVSRVHARIQRDEAAHHVLHDAGSANGTFVNGQLVHEPYLLQDKDRIGLGTPESVLQFVDDADTVGVAFRLEYDHTARQFLLDKKPLDLTSSEMRLLHHLYEHRYEICTQESCIRAVWGNKYDLDQNSDGLAPDLYHLISSLRKKLALATDPHTPLEPKDWLETIQGSGYVLKPKRVESHSP